MSAQPSTTHRHHLLDTSPEEVLLSLTSEAPLYLHARNWMAEMAAIRPLTEPILDEEQLWLSYPEQGLTLSLSAIRCLHRVSIEHRCRTSLALEIATRGEPRSISIAAIPTLSDLDAFAEKLAPHACTPLTRETYETWRKNHLIRPTACPCCQEAAEKRRKNPENNPITRILCSAIDQRQTLHCTLSARAFHFSQSILPHHILLSDKHISVTGDDHRSMLEIDPGLCHSLHIERRVVDAEQVTRLMLFNSLGIPELTLETSGWDSAAHWQELCM
ncbi:MAG: hypothetical protein QM627_02285 [Luteolibacter sp.]